ncbi:MAG TPA: dihydrodipicolinate reductase C-terminal domain-containing protein [Candidatus Saccharimonadales bacterium]|nr:dihydrodipicolinate reductase C-terminal domain-containing protein [Candidatus Saccharimonadales bacterium]
MIKVVVVGAKGRMGQIAVEVMNAAEGFEVVGEVDKDEDLDAILKQTTPDIAIEFSGSEAVKENSWTIVNNSVRPVIGSSGLSQAEIEELEKFCKEKGLGGILVPNFSLGMALSNKFAKELSRYFKDISIIEFHHTKKQDKPSGTARNTAQAVGIDESLIASVRSGAFVAKQQMFFARDGERVVIDHETFNRKDSFGGGILLSCQKVMGLSELVVGLEKILD